MARSEHRARLRPLIAITVALMVLISACGVPSTAQRYAAGDGTRGDLGDQIAAENLLVLTDAAGAEGTLVGGLVNQWEQAVEVTLTFAGIDEAVTMTIDGGGTLLLHPDHHSVVLPSVPVPPGAMVDVQISTGQQGSITVPVPVLDGTLHPYQDYLPGAGV